MQVISPLGIKSLTKFAVLNTQLLLTQFLREGIGEKIFQLAVTSSFAYDEKTCQEFGNVQKVRVGNSITFLKEDLEKPFVTQNERTWSMLESELQRQLALFEEGIKFSSRLQKELLFSVPKGDFQIEKMAATFGYSSRTLQRKLSKENTSYQEQLQLVQENLAKSYIALGYSSEKITQLLGYSEVNAFSRAFKKWTGLTVGEYRKQN